jgi:outer membrane protein
MKQIIFLFTLSMLVSAGTKAQTDSSFSLKQCIDYALENVASVKNARLDEYIATAKIGDARSAGLPQVTATGNITYNPLLQRNFFSGTNPLLPAFDSGFVASNKVYAEQNLFQLKTSGTASATINQLLFNGSYLVGLQAAKTVKQLSEKAVTQSKIQTIENVTKAYYVVLITQERLKLLYANVARLDSSLRQTRTMRDNGLAEKIDVDRIEVSYNNTLTDAKKSENLYIIYYTTLKFQMGMPFEKILNLSGNLSELNAQIKAIQNARITDYAQRIEYSTLQTQKQANYLQLKYIQSGYLPVLSAFGTIGLFRMDENVVKLLNGVWYPYNLIGINFNLPIFDGLSKHYRSQQAKLDIRKTENSLINTKNMIDMQVQQSSLTMNNNLQALEAQKRNLDLSTEVARIAKIKYQEGVGSNLELTTAETSLKESQTNYYSALYDLIISNVDYQKSLGLLINY